MGIESEFPGNSRFGRVTAEPAQEKKVTPVTEGRVVTRKKPLGKRFAELFIATDGTSVRQYVLLEVVLPAIKDTLADAVSQGVEQLLFGQGRSSGRRTGMRPSASGNSGYVSYNRYTASSAKPARPDERPQISQRARSMHDFREILMATRGEADEVLNSLRLLIEQFDIAAVADLYKLANLESSHTDEKWGWTDLSDVTITRDRHGDGYLLNLPKPEPLN